MDFQGKSAVTLLETALTLVIAHGCPGNHHRHRAQSRVAHDGNCLVRRHNRHQDRVARLCLRPRPNLSHPERSRARLIPRRDLPGDVHLAWKLRHCPLLWPVGFRRVGPV